MNKILISLCVIAFATGYISSVYSSDDDNKSNTDKTTITAKDLPDDVSDALVNRCPPENVKEISKVTYQGKTAYEITCTKDGTTHYILMDKEGKLIRDQSTKYEKNNNDNGNDNDKDNENGNDKDNENE